MRCHPAPGLAAGLLAAALVLPLAAAPAAAGRYPSVADYAIAATFDPGERTVRGRETVTWRNSGAVPARELCFHLYLNAFANSRSSFVKGLAAESESWDEWLRRHPDGWGYTTVEAIRVAGVDRVSAMRFERPDDANLDDFTVFHLPLAAPVAPGESVDVEIDFLDKLPKIAARTGVAGPFAFVAQWFPKLGVFEDGAWNCHQYHATTEFFADFGTYDVTLTVPADAVVGATGVLQEQRDDPLGTRTLRFRAEDVHDFAWTADPRFRDFEEDVDGTRVRLLLQPAHVGQRERHFEAVRAAMRRYREWIGPYPYPQLTVVDPGPGGLRAGGMEYPTLITLGTTWWMPRGLRVPEFLAVHEFGHQYWYGMVASNEFEEAWLDEGVNSFLEARILDATYGRASWFDLFGLRLDGVAAQRLHYLSAPGSDPVSRGAWRFRDAESYSAISYAKTALLLETLDRRVGDDVVRRALAAYFDRWQGRHPRGRDLVAEVERAAGRELGSYFAQLVDETGVLDYAVTEVEVVEDEGRAGYPIRDGRVGAPKEPQRSDPPLYRNRVVVERLGSVRLPVDVRVTFDDGSSVVEKWDGEERWRRFEYSGAQRVEWAAVDPNGTAPLDVNLLNNSRMRAAGTRGIVRLAGRWGFWLQSLVQLASGF